MGGLLSCWTGRTGEVEPLPYKGMDSSHDPPGTGGNLFCSLWHLAEVIINCRVLLGCSAVRLLHYCPFPSAFHRQRREGKTSVKGKDRKLCGHPDSGMNPVLTYLFHVVFMQPELP